MNEHLWIDEDGTRWTVRLRRVGPEEAEHYGSPWLVVVEDEGSEPAIVGVDEEEAAGFDAWDEEDVIRFIGIALEERSVGEP